MQGSRRGQWIAAGLIFGAVFGVLTGNFGLWLGLGILIGGGLEARRGQEG